MENEIRRIHEALVAVVRLPHLLDDVAKQLDSLDDEGLDLQFAEICSRIGNAAFCHAGPKDMGEPEPGIYATSARKLANTDSEPCHSPVPMMPIIPSHAIRATESRSRRWKE